MSNAVYGKTIKQLHNRSHINLVMDPDKVMKLIRKPTCKRFEIINSDLVMILSVKRQIVMNKPIYAGMAVLDIAKTVMYQFHYQYATEIFGANCCLRTPIV